MKVIKIIASMLIFLTLFNFISSNVVLATGAQGTSLDDTFKNKGMGSTANMSPDITGQLESGEVNSKNEGGAKVSMQPSTLGKFISGTILGILALIANAFIVPFDVMAGMLTSNNEATADGTDFKFFFTIDRMVFNRIPLLNNNYFSLDEYQVGDITIEPNEINTTIKKSIMKTYYICKLLSVSIGLLALVYIGIRMAISTVASDQAKYKKMLVSWVESVIILFLMVYIMSAIIIFGEMLTSLFYEIRCNVLEADTATGTVKGEVFEDTIRYEILSSVLSLNGLKLAEYSLIYWAMLFTELRFLWLYAKRFLMTGFLIAISPLITITYSIDKAGDGKAQAFSAWLNDFILNILIQPLHALIYLIMVLTANSICARSPLLTILLLLALGQTEKVVKTIFGMNKSITLRGVNALGSKEG